MSNTATGGSSIIDDFRRQTQIIASPRLFKNTPKERYCSNDNLYTGSSHHAYDLKTPKMRRSFSNNNLISPSSLSFVDKTVVVVAGNGPHQTATDYYEDYPQQIFSTLKKRARFQDEETNQDEVCDANNTVAEQIIASVGPVTPKLADFIQQPQMSATQTWVMQTH